MRQRTLNLLRIGIISLALLAITYGIMDGQVRSVFTKAIYI